MEVLSEILRGLRVEGSVYRCSRLEPPWQLEVGHDSCAGFHVVREGCCWIQTKSGYTEKLQRGDLVFIGAGIEHSIASHRDGQPVDESACGVIMLCGHTKFDAGSSHPLLDAIPDFTVIRAEELARHPWLQSTLDQISATYMTQQPGTELVVNKLTEVLLVQLLQINFARDSQPGFVQALNDKSISKALRLIHAEPERAWTIESLASEAAMSRAAFARRFKELAGLTVFAYLTEIRMQRASELLKTTAQPINAIADQVGYQSDLTFANAFKRHHGISPSRFRKAG